MLHNLLHPHPRPTLEEAFKSCGTRVEWEWYLEIFLQTHARNPGNIEAAATCSSRIFRMRKLVNLGAIAVSGSFRKNVPSLGSLALRNETAKARLCFASWFGLSVSVGEAHAMNCIGGGCPGMDYMTQCIGFIV